MSGKIIIGIDPGVNTGFAIIKDGELTDAYSASACEVEDDVILNLARISGTMGSLKIYIEDARKRKWIPSHRGREVLQGVGSVKRDCQRWEEFCEYHKIDYELVAPANNKTKTTASQFKRITRYGKRTNEHGRDAAMLIFGRMPKNRAGVK